MFYYKEISDKIIGAAFEVYNTLGNGFLEKVYENSLMEELKIRKINAVNQKPISVRYKNKIVGEYFADLIVENKIIIELKVCKEIAPEHEAQLINYLKATGVKVGYILNFGYKEKLQYQRIVY